MDISPISNPKAVATTAPVVPIPQPVDTKVATIAASDRSASTRSQKPFIAQIVNAKLATSRFSEKETTTQASERVLRPYGVPMLPYQDNDAPTKASSDTTVVELAPQDSLVPATQKSKIA